MFDEASIRERSRVIGYAIDARRQRWPEETPYTYQPFVEQGLKYNWNEQLKAVMHDCNLLEMCI